MSDFKKGDRVRVTIPKHPGFARNDVGWVLAVIKPGLLYSIEKKRGSGKGVLFSADVLKKTSAPC